MKEPECQCGRHKRHRLDPWVGKIPWRRACQPSPVFLAGESPWTEEPGGLQSIQFQRVGFLASSAGKESACNAGDPSSIRGSGVSPGKGKGYSLQYSGLENPYRQRSLAGSSSWGHKDTTEQLSTAQGFVTHIE